MCVSVKQEIGEERIIVLKIFTFRLKLSVVIVYYVEIRDTALVGCEQTELDEL